MTPETAVQAQAWSAATTAIATVVLAVITWAYVRESKRMADEMVEGRRAAREDARLAGERARRSLAERLVNMLCSLSLRLVSRCRGGL